MTTADRSTRSFALVAAGAAAVFLTLSGSAARADSTPIGSLPRGPVAKMTTSPGLLAAIALPQPRRSSGLVWRIARRYDSRVIRQVSEADVRSAVVFVFEVVRRGDASLQFALTRGDTSPKATKAVTYKIHVAPAKNQ